MPSFDRRCTAVVAISLAMAALRGLAPVDTATAAAPERVWSQQRIAWDHDGSPIPPLVVRAEEFEGLATFDFEIASGVALRVETNVSRPFERGLATLASTVTAAWHHARKQLDIAPRGDVLLYLIDVQEEPQAFRFEAHGELASRYGEVRLAWIPRGARLAGRGAPASLEELVFDTLPHEFVHDQLDQLPMLWQETSRGPNPGTRWFVEGLCELVAKEFSRSAAPGIWADTVRMRRLEQATRLLDTSTVLLEWSQTGASPQRESDLYGASMLVLRVWTRQRDLPGLMRRLRAAPERIGGRQLLGWMREDLGHPDADIMALAHEEAAQLLVDLRTREALARLHSPVLAR